MLGIALFIVIGFYFAHPIVTVLAKGRKWRAATRTFIGFGLMWPLITPILWQIRQSAIAKLNAPPTEGEKNHERK